jgi:LemA protein
MITLILVGFIAFLVMIAVWFIAAYNGLVSIRNQVRNAWSQIDFQL